MPANRSSSWPLAWMWAGLIVYASLHPFWPWHWPVQPPGQDWRDLLWLPMSRYTRFDFWSNYLAYQPLGLLLAVAWMRGGSAPWRAGLQAAGVGVLLSLSMEWTQYVLPQRVPSRMDWGLNSAGALTGAALALALQHLGLLAGWQRLRDGLFVPHGTLGLGLLLSWPIGLLFPTPVPLSPGPGLARLASVLDDWVTDTPLEGWVPDPAAGSSVFTPGIEAVVVALGLLAPCLVSFVMLRHTGHRLVTLAGACVLGITTTALSTALNFGPDHAMSWLTRPVIPGVLAGLILGGALAFMHRRVVAALGLVLLTGLIALVNQSAADPYFALSLQAWEQGRFIRFHGLAQWIGWVWPLAALIFLMMQVITPPRPCPPG